MKLLSIIIVLMSLFCFPSDCHDRNEDNGLKIMSFNIRISPNKLFDGENSWYKRRKHVVKMIRREEPDLLGVQEAIYHQAKYLEEKLDDYTKYGVDRNGGIENGEAEACAVFFKTERFELLNKGTFWLSETPDKPSKGWDSACSRVITWVRLKEKDTDEIIYFMNTHFDHKGDIARTESSKLAVSRIQEILAANNDDIHNVPVILTGDFNCGFESESLAPLRSFMQNARTTAPVTDSTATYNAWGKTKNKETIDHIFYKNLLPVSYRAVTDKYRVPYLSDHYAIIFEAEL